VAERQERAAIVVQKHWRRAAAAAAYHTAIRQALESLSHFLVHTLAPGRVFDWLRARP